MNDLSLWLPGILLPHCANSSSILIQNSRASDGIAMGTEEMQVTEEKLSLKYMESEASLWEILLKHTTHI